MKRNPARARRAEYRTREVKSTDEFGEEWTDYENEWIDHPAFLTEGHFDLPMVKEAVRIASRAKESKSLGRGHFGEAFVVETSKGPVLVKVAAERMLYQDQRPWTLKEQRANLMHEAGVANELEEMGYTFVPRSVYVELEDGTPAIVREYGEFADDLSPDEFYMLEKELLKLEQKDGWRVEDDLLVLRRADGSLFIGDVGLWQAPTIRAKPKKWSNTDSSLSSLLGNLAKERFGKRVATLPRILQLVYLLEGRPSQRNDAFMRAFEEDLREDLESREALGIPSPAKAYRSLERS